ncbi:hypothetical protein D477_003293 [Arthrobacter crystallopoietes BAB-32]|uniref:Uncharacterized protein n=1 Tax=Arthrobacter crystallopoietes BAB-32 TaxID=1246476 RepID=N1V2W5_9MICC|nr:hypothetical protein D477_003293 [Arthrobacter crystallopoietes BAB-32]
MAEGAGERGPTRNNNPDVSAQLASQAVSKRDLGLRCPCNLIDIRFKPELARGMQLRLQVLKESIPSHVPSIGLPSNWSKRDQRSLQS